MEEVKALFDINLFGYAIPITMSIFVQWVVIAIVGIIAYVSTRNLKKRPDRKQSVVELFVAFVNNLVKDNMGSDSMKFVPYIGTLIVFITLLNLIGLIGIEPPTQDYSVALGFAIVSFFVIQVNAIKKHGVGSYFKGMARPFAFLLPINIMERIMLPVSLSLRLFGNMTAGGVIIALVYKGMGHLAVAVPVPLHFYFDVFDGLIQTAIFVMLTMINIKVVSDH